MLPLFVCLVLQWVQSTANVSNKYEAARQKDAKRADDANMRSVNDSVWALATDELLGIIQSMTVHTYSFQVAHDAFIALVPVGSAVDPAWVTPLEFHRLSSSIAAFICLYEGILKLAVRYSELVSKQPKGPAKSTRAKNERHLSQLFCALQVYLTNTLVVRLQRSGGKMCSSPLRIRDGPTYVSLARILRNGLAHGQFQTPGALFGEPSVAVETFRQTHMMDVPENSVFLWSGQDQIEAVVSLPAQASLADTLYAVTRGFKNGFVNAVNLCRAPTLAPTQYRCWVALQSAIDAMV